MTNRDVSFNRGLLRGYFVSKVDGSISYSGKDSYADKWHRVWTDYANSPRPKPSDLLTHKTPLKINVTQEYDRIGIILDHPYSTEYVPVGYYTRPISRHYVDGLNFMFDGDLRLKIKGMKVNLAQDVAEYRQACSMFSNAATDLVSVFRNLRGGRGFSEFVRILKDPRNPPQRRIANRWLEYQYGLKPLMSDLHELVAEKLAKVGPNLPRRLVSIQRALSYDWEDKITLNFTIPQYITWVETQDIIVRSRAIFSTTTDDLRWLANHGFTNPAELAWELIPYSFVADWLFNVGDVLSGLDALVGVKLESVQTAAFKTIRMSSDRGTNGSETESFRYNQRTDLDFGRIRYEPSKSLTAVLNGLALLTQIRSKR